MNEIRAYVNLNITDFSDVNIRIVGGKNGSIVLK